MTLKKIAVVGAGGAITIYGISMMTTDPIILALLIVPYVSFMVAVIVGYIKGREPIPEEKPTLNEWKKD